jgi:hypothetical protein
MANQRYNTPSEGTLDWHVPLNENFDRLDRDVELRDLESNMSNYDPAAGAKLMATDTGAVYTGDGTSWSLVGYVTRAGGGDLGHYVNYPDGLVDEEINKFFLGPDEELSVIRLSLPMKGASADSTDPDVTLRVYEGGTSGTLLAEVSGNDSKSAATDSSNSWIASTSPVVVTLTNSSGASIDAVPKVWVNIRR